MEMELMFTGEDVLELRQAILFYKAASGAALATIHDVKTADGVPALLAGECLSSEKLETMLRELSGTTLRREILPENVFFADGVKMAWWIPSSLRPIFFATADKAFNQSFIGKNVFHPALVMIAEAGRLSVFALEASERPSGRTSLFRAPYFNLYENGVMCAGNVRLPDSPVPRDIPIWEKYFFETNFTHSNLHGGKLTSHSEGHNGYWQMKRFHEAPSFETLLIPLDMTLEQAVNR